MSSFIPTGTPIAIGLLILPATRFNIILFNSVNQTCNAFVNYENSSGSADSSKEIAISYILALTTSVGAGIFFKSFFLKKAKDNFLSQFCIRILPSCLAGSLNILFMRNEYITNGIKVKQEDGTVVGKSKICGLKALTQGVMTRFALPLSFIPIFLAAKRLQKFNFSKFQLNTIEIILVGLCLGFGIPMSLALFKQHDKINSKWLEKSITDKLNKENGWVFYDKGL